MYCTFLFPYVLLCSPVRSSVCFRIVNLAIKELDICQSFPSMNCLLHQRTPHACAKIEKVLHQFMQYHSLHFTLNLNLFTQGPERGPGLYSINGSDEDVGSSPDGMRRYHSDFRVLNATLYHNGTYTCSAVLPYGASSTAANITVLSEFVFLKLIFVLKSCYELEMSVGKSKEVIKSNMPCSRNL